MSWQNHIWIIWDNIHKSPSYAFAMDFYKTKKEAQQEINRLCDNSILYRHKDFIIKKYVLEPKD